MDSYEVSHVRQKLDSAAVEKSRKQYPRLRHCTLVDTPNRNTTKLVVGASYFEVVRHGSRDAFLKLKSLLDGNHSLDEIAELSHVKIEDVREIVSQFDLLGLLQSHPTHEIIRFGRFRDVIEDTCLMWRRQIGLHPLFGGLIDKVYPSQVFVGLLIETYHYTKMLSPLIERIAQRAPEHISTILADYAAEEQSHHLDLLSGLKQIPRIGKRIFASHPTAGTKALLDRFMGTGMRSEFSLLCCLVLIEARASEAAEAAEQFRKIAEHFELQEVAEPFVRHMELDVKMGHSSILNGLYPDEYELDINEVHLVANDLHDLKHAYDLFHNDIVEYYSDISNYIPRHKVDFFGL